MRIVITLGILIAYSGISFGQCELKTSRITIFKDATNDRFRFL